MWNTYVLRLRFTEFLKVEVRGLLDSFMLKMKFFKTINALLILSVLYMYQCVNAKTSKVADVSSSVESVATVSNLTDTNSDNDNSTLSSMTQDSDSLGHYFNGLNIDGVGAVKRTFYVVASLTGVFLLCMIVKAVRSSRKRKVHRYGLLVDQEMNLLDEEEDTTLFDANRHKKLGKK